MKRIQDVNSIEK